jgi:hypothetical protein
VVSYTETQRNSKNNKENSSEKTPTERLHANHRQMERMMAHSVNMMVLGSIYGTTNMPTKNNVLLVIM